MIIKNNFKNISLSGLFMAMGILLPVLFHFVFTGSGPVLLPMHIPIILGSFFLSPMYALSVGICTPVLSSILTGMPPFYPMLPIMILELLTISGVVSFLNQKNKINIYIILLAGMILARIITGFTVYFMVLLFNLKMDPFLFIKGALITGMPGISIQLIFIPVLVKIIKSRFIK